MILFLAFLWVVAPLTVYLLGGSVFWEVAAGIIGGLVVFGAMGLQWLADHPRPPSSEEMADEAALREERDRQLAERARASRQHALDEIVQPARSQPIECPTCHLPVRREAEEAHRDWHWSVDGWIERREDYEREQAERA